MDTVLFPQGPNAGWKCVGPETSRGGTYLIVINGQSAWTAPKGSSLCGTAYLPISID